MISHLPQSVAAVRGAVSVPRNDAPSIEAATRTLLVELLRVNGLVAPQIVSAVFTATPDLDADFPARAARSLGWHDVPLLGAAEMGVPGAPPRLVRVLLTVQRAGGKPLVPVYLGEAARLRPDLFPAGPAPAEASVRAIDLFDPGAETPTPESPARTRVALLGLGQIGGSIGLALGAAGGWWRVGFDADPEVARAALARGAVDAIAPTLEAAVSDAELAVAAVPVDRIPAVLNGAAAHLPRGATIIDTGSARGPVTPALVAASARGLRAVGGHPLAGTEGHGLAAARADLFHGAGFALLPLLGETIPPLACRLVADLGALPLIVDAPAHDEALARTSHLPWVLATALAALGRDPAARGLAGPGFQGMTRIARARPGVARAYCVANVAEIRAAWGEMRQRVEALLADLGDTRAGHRLDPFDPA